MPISDNDWLNRENLNLGSGKFCLKFNNLCVNLTRKQYIGSVPDNQYIGSEPDNKYIDSVPDNQYIGSVPDKSCEEFSEVSKSGSKSRINTGKITSINRTCLSQKRVLIALLWCCGKLVEPLGTVPCWKGVNVMCPRPGCSPLKGQYWGSELIADWKVLDLIMIFLLEKN